MRGRGIDKVVAPEAIEAVGRQVNSVLSQLLRELPAPANNADPEQRLLVLHETARLTTRAALVVLIEFHLEHYRSIIDAAIRYERDRLRGRPAVPRQNPIWAFKRRPSSLGAAMQEPPSRCGPEQPASAGVVAIE
jgi:hypothetical protein